MLAFWVFLLAICTDFVDGFVARRSHHPNRLGKVLDPVCDKVLTNACWLMLAYLAMAPFWLAGCVIIRDLCIGLGWLQGIRVKASWYAQMAVAFEGTALCVYLHRGPWLDVNWDAVGLILGCIALILAAVSALEYGWQAMRTLPPTREAS